MTRLLSLKLLSMRCNNRVARVMFFFLSFFSLMFNVHINSVKRSHLKKKEINKIKKKKKKKKKMDRPGIESATLYLQIE